MRRLQRAGESCSHRGWEVRPQQPRTILCSLPPARPAVHGQQSRSLQAQPSQLPTDRAVTAVSAISALLRPRPDGPYHAQPSQRRLVFPPRYAHIPGLFKTVIPEPPAAAADTSPSISLARSSSSSTHYFSLTGYPRAKVGSHDADRLRRRRNHIPAVIFFPEHPQHGHVHLSIERAPLEALLRRWSEAGLMTRIGAVTVEQPATHELDEQTAEQRAVVSPGSRYTVRLSAIHRHSVSDEVMDVVFSCWAEDRPSRVSLPLLYINELEAAGVRKGGILFHIKRALSCWYCGPAALLPSHIVIDLLHFPMGRSLLNTDVPLSAGLRLFAPHKQLVLCSIQGLGRQARWEDEDDATAAAAAAGTAAGAAAPAKAAGGGKGTAALGAGKGAAAATPAAGGGGGAAGKGTAAATKKEDPKKK